jgi:microsomal epoxide hydrolase
MRQAFRAASCGLLAALLATAVQGEPAARNRLVQVEPDVRIRVVEKGAPSTRPTLVLVPGWTFTADVWREEIERFSKDRRVIAIDPRSQGQSTKTAFGDTPEQRARDLRAVLDQLKPGPVVLVGWSQGVQDVAAYVGEFGTQGVSGVVLVDSSVSRGAASMADAPKVAAAQFAQIDYMAKDPEAYVRGMDGAIIRRPLPKPDLDRLVASQLQTPPAIAVGMWVADLWGVDRTPALAKLDCPTLVIASAYSPELDVERAQAAKLPHARFEVVDNAGHAVFLDQPETFDALVASFLAEIDGRSAR